MTEELKEAYDGLRHASEEFLAGRDENKSQLHRAQWEFDLAKRGKKHQTKIQNILAKEYPHAPVVSSIADSKDTLATSIMTLRDSLVETMREQIQSQNVAITALISEVRELRRVSSLPRSLGVI